MYCLKSTSPRRLIAMFKFGLANTNQKKAIQTTEGPLLIIAGPGTGKTFTLIKRVMYLIASGKTLPENIMIVTFTEKAAKEILTRLSNELLENNIEINVHEMYVGTIHSVALKLIKENIEFSKMKRNFKVYDDFDQQYFIYQNYWSKFKTINNFDLVIEQVGPIWDRVTKLQKYINLISEELIDTNEFTNSPHDISVVIGEILKTYNDLREEYNFIDFASIQTELYRMLADKENGLLEKIQEKIHYFMVDEYQDTNYIQEQIMLLLASKNNNLCVVGDDDQGLYRFRGATIRNILEFEPHFENCKKIILNENYRSEGSIINFYNDFMNTTEGRKFEFDWSKYRFDKHIVASKANKGSFQSTAKIVADTYEEMNEYVLSFIEELRDKGKITDYNQIAFLFRSVRNDNVIRLANYLEENGISVYSPRSNLFFHRHEVKLLLGTLLLMFPSKVSEIKNNDKEWFVDVYRYYIDCINLTILELRKQENQTLEKFIKIKAKEHLLLPEQRKATDYSIAQLIYQLFQFELFGKIVTVDLKDGLKDTMKSRNIAIFIEHIAKFEFANDIIVLSPKNINWTINKLFSEFLVFLFENGIAEFEDETEYAPSGSVSFLTIHQAKGMEFPIVMVGSLFSVPREDNDDVLFHIETKHSRRKLFEPRKDIKFFDFWRLFYTAFSRAQNLLVLFSAKESRGISKYFETQIEELSEFNDYDNLVVESIKTTNIKRSYSFTTDINLYENSPIEYLFFKELGYTRVSYGAAIFGQLVHTTIEDIHKAILKGEKDNITNDVINLWMMSNYDAISRAERNFLSPRFLETAFDQIVSYYEKRSGEWGMLKEAEIPISIVKKDYILSGKIDLLQGQDGKYEIIDFKTEKKPDIFKEKKRLDRSRKQLELYAHILEERYGYEITKLKIYYTSEKNTNPIIEFKKDKESINKTISYFDEIVNKIENKEFSTNLEDNNISRNSDLRYYLKIV